MASKKKDMSNTPKYSGDKAYLYMIPLECDTYKIDGYALFFPVKLRERINIENDKAIQRMPLKSLHDSMFSLLSDLLFINNKIDVNINEPWLFAEHLIDLGHIRNMISAWFSLIFKTELEPEYLQEIRWVKHTRTFRYTVDEMNKVRFGDQFVFNYITKFLASQVKGKYFIESLEQTLNFIPIQSERYGQLISWPPLEKDNLKFSYRINLSLQTIPFVPKPYLYIHVETLRWVVNDKIYPNAKSFHVYLREQFPWSIGESPSCFTLIEACRNDDGWYWGNRITAILKKIGFDSLLPTCKEWMENADRFLEGHDTSCVLAVPHSSHLKNKTKLEAGAGMPERYDIAKLIADRLGNSLETVKKVNSRIVVRDKEINLSLPDELDIEIYYENDQWMARVEDTLKKELGINDLPLDKTFFLHNSKIRIIPVRSNLDLNIIKPVDVSKSKTFKEHLPKLIDELKPVSRFTGCLFELPFKDQFDDQQLDPKHLLRYAFARSNRLVQFINQLADDSSKNGDHRFTNGCQDLFRQLGAIGARSKGIMKQDTVYLGIYYLDKRKNLKKNQSLEYPIICMIDQGDVFLTAPGIDWLPYREALIALGKQSLDIHRRSLDREKSKHFIAQTIQQLQANQVIIFVHAQNIRGIVPWFNNNQISYRSFHIKDDTVISNKEISVVRLRNETDYEAPEWSLIGYKSIRGVKQHPNESVWPQATNTNLYKLNDYIYYSVAKKPDSSQAAMGLTKLDNPYQYNRKETALEVAIPICGSAYSREQLARLTHQLRKDTSYQYKGDTLFPLPLHLAMKAREYALALEEL